MGFIERRLVPLAPALPLAILIHLDWHLARSTHHGALSFGFSWHWILAVPAFGLLAWHAHRAWGPKALRSGLGIVALAVFLAQVVEPCWELTTGASLEWTFGPERLGAAGLYVAVGLFAFVSVLRLLRRSPSPH